MTTNIARVLARSPVIPVLVVPDVALAVPLARALVENGLQVLEVTLRTACALEVIREMKMALPHASIGAGTVLNHQHLLQACKAGADFCVSPGSTSALLAAAGGEGMPLLPGANTPSEIMALLDQGVSVMKFFPAEPAGGVAMLNALSGPLPQVSFCPTGGIHAGNASEYLALKNVICVGGSWMVTNEQLKERRWREIGESAARVAALS